MPDFINSEFRFVIITNYLVHPKKGWYRCI